MGIYGPFLIVAPLTTLNNWRKEINRFSPSIPCLIYHGPKDQLKKLRDKHFKTKGPSFPWILTSYEVCLNNATSLKKIDFKYMVVDEGHRLKNFECKLVKVLKSFKADNRLLLTGVCLGALF